MSSLIKADLWCFKKSLLDKWIDLTIWIAITTINTVYIMPYFGLQANFGLVQLGGIIAAIGLFELYSSNIQLVADYEHDRMINYALTLPIPSSLAIISKALYYFTVYMILSVITLPINKLVFGSMFNYTSVNWLFFTIAIVAQNCFYACFVLWTSSIIKNMDTMGKVWSRFIFPMWFMGGFNFSWYALYNTIPSLAYVSLLNPMIYITETTRIALQGQSGYMNFWLCISAIIFFALFFGSIGMYNLKKRLDFI